MTDEEPTRRVRLPTGEAGRPIRRRQRSTGSEHRFASLFADAVRDLVELDHPAEERKQLVRAILARAYDLGVNSSELQLAKRNAEIETLRADLKHARHRLHLYEQGEE